MFILFLILFLVCFCYYVYMISYAGLHTAFATVWLCMALGFLAFAVVAFILKKKNVQLPFALKAVASGIAAIIVIFFLLIEGMIISKMNENPPDNLDYIIVLGAQVRGEKITKSLAKRLEQAYDYMIENPDTVAVLSGGQGDGEDISEAEAMYGYLVTKGIAADRLIMEDASTNTEQNITFSMNIIDSLDDNPDRQIGVVTNNFHVLRTELVCSKMGYKVYGIAAASDNKLLVNYMFREFFALIKYKISGNI